jgi:hypothetical protein
MNKAEINTFLDGSKQMVFRPKGLKMPAITGFLTFLRKIFCPLSAKNYK